MTTHPMKRYQIKELLWSCSNPVDELPLEIDDPYEYSVQLLLDYINDSDVKQAFEKVKQRYG